MTEPTYEQVRENAMKVLADAEAYRSRQRRTEEANAEYRRRRDQRTILEYDVPDFAAPMRRLREEYDEAVAKVRNDQDLTDEAKDRRLRELTDRHGQQARQEAETVRDRMGSYLSRYRAIAKVNDEPADEIRYARLEREFMARVAAGRVPDLESYWEAIESGDRDRVRVFEVHAPLYIEDAGQRNGFNAEVENQRQHRLTDEQKLARQRIRELEAKTDDFEMGSRLGAFGPPAEGGGDGR